MNNRNNKLMLFLESDCRNKVIAETPGRFKMVCGMKFKV
jgi:hypothetical protein